MADADKATLLKIGKLVEAQKDLSEKLAASIEELDRLLAGKAGIGSVLARLEATFEACWCGRYGAASAYVWNRARDRALMKKLLRVLDVDEIEARMRRYAQSDDVFYRKARHSFPVFVVSINALTEAPAEFALDAPAVVDCRHTPRCASEQLHTRAKMAEMRA